jgi:hypothetical protein
MKLLRSQSSLCDVKLAILWMLMFSQLPHLFKTHSGRIFILVLQKLLGYILWLKSSIRSLIMLIYHDIDVHLVKLVFFVYMNIFMGKNGLWIVLKNIVIFGFQKLHFMSWYIILHPFYMSFFLGNLFICLYRVTNMYLCSGNIRLDVIY